MSDETAQARVSRMNEAQIRFLALHAFEAPHHWVWLGVDWKAVSAGAPRTGRLKARSQTRQATIPAADLRAIDDCWTDFPRVDGSLTGALKDALRKYE